MMAVISARALATVGVVLALGACGSTSTGQSSPTTSRPATTSTTSATSSSTTRTTASTTTTSTTTVPRASNESLFPFGDLQEVTAWQAAAGPEHQPWRLDAGETALAFARFLGFTDLDRVISVSNDATGAHVAVGFETEGSHTSTAAVVHLIRFGSGTSIPWEVVGTDDTDFTLETPHYGATITSPVRVGGRITGVDESITVRVQQLHANGYLGEHCCVAAGGEGSSWATTLTFAAPTDPVLIISASTGGHIQRVERFAVTGVKRG
jgi:hypothetical protein